MIAYIGTLLVDTDLGAAALLYDDPADRTWTAMKAEKGSTGILKTQCSLQEMDPLYQNILIYRAQLSADPKATVLKFI